jgi:hypothetical protein
MKDQVTYLLRTGLVVSRRHLMCQYASKHDNAAASERETKKIRKYAELNAINPAPINYQFCPYSFGSWSEDACKIIVRIAKSQATVIGLSGHIATLGHVAKIQC